MHRNQQTSNSEVGGMKHLVMGTTSLCLLMTMNIPPRDLGATPKTSQNTTHQGHVPLGPNYILATPIPHMRMGKNRSICGQTSIDRSGLDVVNLSYCELCPIEIEVLPITKNKKTIDKFTLAKDLHLFARNLTYIYI